MTNAPQDRPASARERFETHRDSAGKFYTRPDNRDSWADVCERTYIFLGKLFQANRHGAHVLIVSHAVTIATFAFHLDRLSEDGVVELYRANRIPELRGGAMAVSAGSQAPVAPGGVGPGDPRHPVMVTGFRHPRS